MSLPSARDLPRLPASQLAEALGLLFEPCPTLVELVRQVLEPSVNSWPELIERARAQFHNMREDDPRVFEIIAAHPRLGAAKVESASSQAEQKSLQAASAAEANALADLNAQYEHTFPGLRYVVFVAGRPRTTIMENMRSRISEGNRSLEIRRALDAMCDIALDRCTKMGGGKL